CDVFFQHHITDSIGLEDNIVNRANCKVDFGAGIRVLKGDQTGYSFTEEITKEAMLSAARTAAAIADSTKKVKPIECKSHNSSNYYPVIMPWESVSIDKKIPVLQKINDRIFSTDKRVIKANVFLGNETSYILVANSQGRVTSDYQPMVTVFANCIAEQNGHREQNFHYISGRYGMEFLNDQLIRTLADTAVQRTIALFEAVKVAGGEMALVLTPGTSGILLHEAIGHGMEADFNRKGISIFSDMIGKPVAEKFVNIIDDGTVENNRGAINIDDEGNDSQRTYLVKDGILCNYLHDHISAAYYKAPVTGNGRRQSFRFMPQPRMRNTYMLNGPHKHDEIISSVSKGIYAEVFTNGAVNIGAGDFTFYVKSGRLIEDGKLTVPVKDVNIIGNGPKSLKNIVMLGDDFQFSPGGGTCGKGGQGVPISSGLPTVKISNITVGGA
ncbi:MAG: TldD/PmbA family protein, partial [Planctomycetota bacterium]